MKRTLFAALVCAGTVACTSLTSGTAVAPPQHHNIPATFVNDPGGPVYWLCATQPRAYYTLNGGTMYEEDHYLTPQPCPVVPVP